MLTETQLRRYARNISLPNVGIAGQEKLLAAKVLVIGAGGLGSSVISYLAASGIGNIGIIDHDRVELSNLQRQIIFENSDIGRLKVDAASDRINELNPDVSVKTSSEKITPNNANDIIKNYDIIADGSDNFATRFAVNTACHNTKKPLISASIRGFDGQLAVFKSYLGEPQPCYRCFVDSAPDDELGCKDIGVIGALAGIIGSMQAMEIIKEILEIKPSLTGKLLLFNAINLETRKVAITRNPSCNICKKE